MKGLLEVWECGSGGGCKKYYPHTPTLPYPPTSFLRLTLRGTLKFHQLGTRFWELITDDGDHYELMGGDPSLYQDGLRVVVTGQIREDLMSIGNIGPIFEVNTLRQEEK